MVITLQPFLYNLTTNIVIRTNINGIIVSLVFITFNKFAPKVFITFNKFKAHSLPLKARITKNRQKYRYLPIFSSIIMLCLDKRNLAAILALASVSLRRRAAEWAHGEVQPHGTIAILLYQQFIIVLC